MIASSRLAATVVLTGLALALAACSGVTEPLVPATTPASPGAASSSPQASEAPISEDVFAERDAFFESQGGAPDPSKPLTPVTPEQQDFVAQQRAYVIEQGGQVDEQYDTVILALTLDVCETSILNAHRVTEATFATHVASSPLIAALVPTDLDDEQRRDAERNLMSVAVFGTTFLCPDDAPQWQQAAQTFYGS